MWWLLSVTFALVIAAAESSHLNSINDTSTNYIGCFIDKTNNGDLPYYIRPGRELRIEYCILHCRVHGYKYAGAQRPYCFCGHSYGTHGKAENEAKCRQHKCYVPNNHGRIDYCGGNKYNAIYKTDALPESNDLKSEGCYLDTAARDLDTRFTIKFLTRENCYQRCKSYGFKYFGLQKNICSCGDYYGRFGKANDTECTAKCPGSRDQRECGEHHRNNIFPIPVNIKRTAFSYLGCYKDKGARDLWFKGYVGNLNRHDLCVSMCYSKGYSYAGLQNSHQCWCGNTFNRYEKLPDFECYNKVCRKPNQYSVYESCGGTMINRIYYTGYQRKSVGLKPVGCYIDKSTRDLDIRHYASSKLGVEYCYRYCEERGYRYFGLQNGNICACGHKYGRYGRASLSECNKKCSGNWNETCGGSWRNMIYDTLGHPVSINEPVGVTNTINSGNNKGEQGKRKYLGCFEDKSVHDLGELEKRNNPMDLEWCINYCKGRNYKYAGIQSGYQCFCGNSYGRYGEKPEDECTTRRCGRVNANQNSYDSCGGTRRNRIFDLTDGSDKGDTTTTNKNTSSRKCECPSSTESKTEKVCEDPRTGTTYQYGVNWISKDDKFCYHYTCRFDIAQPHRIDCLDTNNNCIESSRQGTPMKCTKNAMCQCKRDGQYSFIQH